MQLLQRVQIPKVLVQMPAVLLMDFYRNPSAAPQAFGQVLLGFALVEAIALFALVIAFLILFG